MSELEALIQRMKPPEIIIAEPAEPSADLTALCNKIQNTHWLENELLEASQRLQDTKNALKLIRQSSWNSKRHCSHFIS